VTSGVRRRAEGARGDSRALATCRAALLAQKRLFAESVLAACLVELLGLVASLQRRIGQLAPDSPLGIR